MIEEIAKQIKEAVGKLFDVEVEPNVTVAPENTGADYASNVTMQLAKLVHKAPMVIGEEMKDLLSERSASSDMVGYRVEVAAPGFLNFIIDDEIINEQVRGYAEDFTKAVENREYRDKVVVAEFSDPNPFKVLHVGHLYTSIVGDGISRLVEYAGGKVVRANFGGDVGLHVGKTLYAVIENGVKSEEMTIEGLAQSYVKGTQAYEEDVTAKAEITRLNKEIYRINEEDIHEGELAQLYWRGRELSYQYFDEFYDRIGVKFDKYYPESSVVQRGVREVRAHTGTTYEESDGAVVYKGEKVGLHTRVFINREGVPTYETKDVGLIFTKWDDWHFDESIVVTGNEQSDYMKVVLASVSEYAPQLVERTTHLTHGMVRLAGNTKMSSRKGNFLKAVDTLQIVREALGGEKADEKVVQAAIKYAFLKYKMGGDIIFDPQESVSTTGNSGVYLLYSAVRAKKILQKAGSKDDIGELTEEEKKYTKILNKKIIQCKDELAEAVREKAPYKICSYLYELSQEFSRFYEHVKVAGNNNERMLMKTVKAYLNVMEFGLELLGIEIPEEM